MKWSVEFILELNGSLAAKHLRTPGIKNTSLRLLAYLVSIFKIQISSIIFPIMCFVRVPV